MNQDQSIRRWCFRVSFCIGIIFIPSERKHCSICFAKTVLKAQICELNILPPLPFTNEFDSIRESYSAKFQDLMRGIAQMVDKDPAHLPIASVSESVPLSSCYGQYLWLANCLSCLEAYCCKWPDAAFSGFSCERSEAAALPLRPPQWPLLI